MFFLREPKRRRQRDTVAKGLGSPEIVKDDKIHKIHTPKLQSGVFSEGAEAPQAAATQTQRAGDPETDNYCRLSHLNLDNELSLSHLAQ